MMKNLLLFFLASLSIMSVRAEDRSEHEMWRIAAAKLGTAGQSADGRMSANGGTTVSKVACNGVYSIYSAKGRGSVIVSRDMAYPEILGYTPTDYSPEATLPCGFKWWLETMEQALERQTENVVSETRAKAVSFTATPAMLTTQWGQSSPYNDLCPVIGNEHALTGCVATAMSQIMRYFRYPESGTGTGYYTINSSGIPRIGNISGTYDWNSMLDSYGNDVVPVGTEAERNAVATLMFEAGVAAQMNYMTDASGAYTSDAAVGLADNFSYDPLSLRVCNRKYYSDEEWMSLVYGELQSGRPILYGGVDLMSGGHAFVLDGIDDNGLVHVNWGWNGNYDGFVDIDLLNSPGGSFSQNQDMIIGFKAQKEPAADEVFRSQWGTDNYTVSAGLGPLSISIGSHSNIHYRTFKGGLGVCCKNTEGTEIYFLPVEGTETGNVTDIEIKAGYGWVPQNTGKTFTYTAKTSTLPAGTYTMFFASKDERDAEPQPFRCYGGPVYYTLSKSALNVVEVSEPQNYPSAVINPSAGMKKEDNVIYTTDGRYVGKDINVQEKGVYIINGKKIMK